MEKKHFYWIKLWEWFLRSDEIKIVLRQRNGPLFVVLYLFLCLDTANYNGFFEKKIGEYVIPYNASEIHSEYVRIFKCETEFSYETVLFALELYDKLNLTHFEDGKRRITNYSKLVGSETSSAERMRRLRDKNRTLTEANKKPLEASQCDKTASQCDKNVTPIRELDSNIIRVLDSYIIEGSSNSDDDPSESQRTLWKGNVLLSDAQVSDLLNKLSLEEFNYYLNRMSEMIVKGYSFSQSPYDKILEMALQDRSVKK